MLFLSQGTLWSAPVRRWWMKPWGGEPAQISFGTPTLFVPYRTRGGRLFTIGDVRLGELQRFDPITHNWQRHLDGISADAVEYSRDGQWVAYVRYPEQSLWRCRADGTQCLQLVDASFGAYLPRWSPDGARIAFQAQHPGELGRIWLVNADGTGLHLAAPDDSDDQRDATWTADGKRIIFGSGVSPPLPGETTSLRILDIDSGQVSEIPGTSGLWNPNASWDGSRLLALTMLQSPRQPVLTILDTVTRHWKRASEEIALFPTWSHDGTSVVYYNQKQIRRFRLDTWKSETIASFDRYQAIGGNLWKGWVGLDHDGAVLVMRNLDVRQIYELEFISR